MELIVRTAARTAVVLALVLTFGFGTSSAQGASGAVKGSVSDALGARIAGATVTLIHDDGRRGASVASGAQGDFLLSGVSEGRYRLEITAEGFATRLTDPFFVGTASRVDQPVSLQIGPLRQEVVVSAGVTAQPQSQVGASVTVIDEALVGASGKFEVFEAIRAVPGVQVVQTGARGGTTSLFIRGGVPGFTKVLVDGVPLNDIGGAFNFADLEAVGIDRVEVLRGSNSVLYGTDALTGVVNVTTKRGRTRRPETSLSTEGGSFGTSRHSGSVGGAFKRVDYFSAYSHADTDNKIANNAFQNDTLAGRLGVAIGGSSDLSVTVRHNASDYGTPNAVGYYGVPDDSTQRTRFTTVGATLRSHVNERLMTSVQIASSDQRQRLVNPTPTGEPFDPFGYGANYLGDLVTIRAANGTTATGQAILDYGGTYPSIYRAESSRRSIYGNADYQIAPSLSLAGGLRVDHERGLTDSGSVSKTTRNNAGAFIEARAELRRLYVNLGLGYDHNAVFGSAVVPRVSLAAYVRPPSSAGMWGETKLTFNAGKGIKGPTVSQELSSLFGFVKGTASAARVSPIGAERSTGVDLGVEQAILGGRARARLAFFDNRFSDLIEFVSDTVLPQLGVPEEVASETSFGAYVNASSYNARGIEASVDAAAGGGLRVLASYMFLDSEVTKSFTGSALEPSINPAYPDTPIGTYAPLVGGRPFRRPVHSGNLTVAYASGRVQAFLSGYFSGKFDESTFLSDGFFGSSMLLPNRDFGAAYRKFDASLSYAFTPEVRAFVTLENLADAAYAAASGFPALPRAARAGLRLTFGGDR